MALAGFIDAVQQVSKAKYDSPAEAAEAIRTLLATLDSLAPPAPSGENGMKQSSAGQSMRRIDVLDEEDAGRLLQWVMDGRNELAAERVFEKLRSSNPRSNASVAVERGRQVALSAFASML